MAPFHIEMLSVSPLKCSKGEKGGDLGGFSVGAHDFSDEISGGNLLDVIDFSELFVGLDDGDILPDLEMDPEMLAEFSSVDTTCSLTEDSEMNFSSSEQEERREKGAKGGSRRQESVVTTDSASSDSDKGRKPATAQTKIPQGKRKMKVDWTPELHRRFVQAVEQLGIDKAVPSRILELMGIDCLTRHNIASHLQKFRSHRKHLLAREAEAVSWSQRWQIYEGGKKEMAPWLAPTMGFPPPSAIQPFRPLHVWGHPTVDQSMLHVFPKHLVQSPSPPQPPWAPPPRPPLLPHPSHWHPHHHHRFSSTPVPGIPSPALYRPDKTLVFPNGQSNSHLQFDLHPSKETLDAAIGDVLAKPWLPLPLGLKPPSLDSVMGELQRHGISKIPPSCA